MRFGPKTSPKRNARAAPRTRRRALAGGSVAAALALAALMLALPYAAAASSSGSVTLKAPYGGQGLDSASWATTGCGTKFSLSPLPDFNTSKGTFEGGLAASARSCGSSNSSLFGEIEGSLGTAEFSVAANGTYRVTVHWRLSYTVSLAATAGSASQFAGSYGLVGAYAVVDDLTNGSAYTVGGNDSYYGSSTNATSTHCAYTVTYSSSIPLITGHEYIVVAGVYAEVNVFLTPGHSSASASVNMGKSGDKASLTSIVIP